MSRKDKMDKIFQGAAETFINRDAEYGDSPRKFGEVMHQLFPEGLTTAGPDEFAKLGLLIQIVSKLTRISESYAKPQGLEKGIDSIHDLGVYSFMLEAKIKEAE